MGRDKAFVEVDGVPLAEVAARALRGAGALRLAAVGGDLGPLGRLGFETVADPAPSIGPLGGIVAALRWASAPACAVLACDLPFVAAAAVRSVVDALEADPGVVAAVPVVEGRREVLLGCYRQSVVSTLEAALAAGQRSPTRVLETLPVATVRLDDERWAWNANRPEDLP